MRGSSPALAAWLTGHLRVHGFSAEYLGYSSELVGIMKPSRDPQILTARVH
jgi:hypothetical protein